MFSQFLRIGHVITSLVVFITEAIYLKCWQDVYNYVLYASPLQGLYFVVWFMFLSHFCIFVNNRKLHDYINKVAIVYSLFCLLCLWDYFAYNYDEYNSSNPKTTLNAM